MDIVHMAIQIANSELDVNQTNAGNEFKKQVIKRNYEGESENFYRSSIFTT